MSSKKPDESPRGWLMRIIHFFGLGTSARGGEFLRAIYSTILSSGLVVLILWLVYSALFKRNYGDSYDGVVGTLTIIGLVTLLGCFLLSRDTEFIQQRIKIPIRVRSMFLPVLTIAIIAELGVIIHYSGGSKGSGFTHLLLATSAVALAFAEKPAVRISILGMCVATYWFAYTPHSHPTSALNADHVKWFDIGCVVLATGIAGVAGWRIREQAKGTSSNGSAEI